MTTPTTTFTSEEIAEMQRIDNSATPIILPARKVSSAWTGHILEKDEGRWDEWLYNMNLELSMAQLWEYVFHQPLPPHGDLSAASALCMDK